MNWDTVPAAEQRLTPTNGEAAVILFYENEVPSFVEEEIERRYGSLFSALPHLCHTGKLTPATSTYVRQVDGRLETLLLFEMRDQRVTVLNELIHLSNGELAAFVAFVFARYLAVSTILFNALSADSRGLQHPVQRYFCSEDIVISSLVSLDEYAARLKKSTHKSIRRHGNALLRAHPSARFTVLPTQAIDLALVRQIIEFNKARMANKDRVSAYTDDELQWVATVAGVRGLAVIVTIDGKLCAGTLCCNIGDRFFMVVSAHDPDYDQFGLGILCSYRTVRECIARGGKEVHLLWGRLPYKTSLGGVPKRFDRITVYRSRTAYLRRLDQALAAAATGLVNETRLWLLDAEGKQTLQGKFADLVWRCARQAKRAVGSFRRAAS